MHRIFQVASMIVAGISAVTISGCGAETAASAASPTGDSGVTSAAGAACAGLEAEMVPLHGAAAGTTFSDLVVVNRGKTPCTLPGQPKLEYLGADHKPIPVAISADASVPAYRLSPGASAAMAIGYGTDGNPPCDAKITQVRVTPPGAILPLDGAIHCANDSAYEESWAAGSYAAP